MKVYQLSLFFLVILILNIQGNLNAIFKDPHGKTLIIAGAGDVMQGTFFKLRKYLPSGDNPQIFIESVIDKFKGSDILFGNHEGSLLRNGRPEKKCRDRSICYLFRIPEKYSGVHKIPGFNVLSMENNRFKNFCFTGECSKMMIIESSGITFAGPDDMPYIIFEKHSVTYGFPAFATGAGSLNLNDSEKAEEIIFMLDSTCNILIVSFRGGAESEQCGILPRETEFFNGKVKVNVYEFVRRMVDAGINLDFGQEPYIPGAIELYNDGIISYIQGNFFTCRVINIAGSYYGITPIMKVRTDITGKFNSGKIMPFFQDAGRNVRYDNSKREVSAKRSYHA